MGGGGANRARYCGVRRVDRYCGSVAQGVFAIYGLYPMFCAKLKFTRIQVVFCYDE